MLLLKVVLVFGLLALVLWVLKRTDGLGGRSRGSLLEVRGSTKLGKGAALTVVRVDGKDLLLGVTDHTVTLLTSEQVEVLPDSEQVASPGVGGSLVSLAGGLVGGLATHLRSGTTRSSRGQVVPDHAVAAALATLRGETPVITNGPVMTSTRLASRRRVARMDALPDEEHPWSRACRPTFRHADGDDALP